MSTASTPFVMMRDCPGCGGQVAADTYCPACTEIGMLLERKRLATVARNATYREDMGVSPYVVQVAPWVTRALEWICEGSVVRTFLLLTGIGIGAGAVLVAATWMVMRAALLTIGLCCELAG